MVYGDVQDKQKAALKALTGDHDRGRDLPSGFEALLALPADGHEGCSFISTLRDSPYLQPYQYRRRRNGLIRLGDRPLKDYLVPSDNQSPASVDVQINALKKAMVWTWRRKLVVTAQGYLGLVPNAARKGDSICLLLGCSLPVILRPLSDGNASQAAPRWKFVGECYIYGIMDGEAMKLAEDNPSIPRTFDIC
jgi:hypothetical protein